MKDAAERGGQEDDIGSQFGITPRSVEQSIQNRIQPAGKPSEKLTEEKQLLHYAEKIQWLKSEELEQYAAEVNEFIENCKSPGVREKKDSWKETMQRCFEIRREELAAEKARADQPGEEEPSTSRARSSRWQDILDALDSIEPPKPSRPTDDPDNGIKKMLERFYFRETDEDTPPDLPNGETPEKKS
jgi:hypothetical protein